MPGIDLMESAGRATFEAATAAFEDMQRCLVICGGGNNCGDGYIVARLAADAGMEVTLCALKAPAELAGDAATAAQRWLAAGGAVTDWPPAEPEQWDVVFDAMLGTGLDREPAGVYGEAVDWINASAAGVVAIDIPSGLNADTGVALGRTVVADLTVTFIGSKRGLFTADGPDYAGEIIYSDLETPDSVRDSEPDSGILIQAKLIQQQLPVRPRNSHKGSFGWLLGVGSDVGMSGAIRLCGEAALRSGAGKVTLATHPQHAALINATCPELMVRAADGAAEITELLAAADVAVVGTGLGKSAWSEELFTACLERSGVLVMDADALNLLADSSFPADQNEHDWVLTPHPAEAARLLQCSTREVQGDRVAAAQAVAGRYRAVCVLKGCGTVIADPQGRYAICPLGNPGMATAGSGDVLTGVIGAMLAQGLDSWAAACTGVVAHAAAGDLAAELMGERGLMASDITDCLPAVLNRDV